MSVLSAPAGRTYAGRGCVWWTLCRSTRRHRGGQTKRDFSFLLRPWEDINQHTQVPLRHRPLLTSSSPSWRTLMPLGRVEASWPQGKTCIKMWSFRSLSTALFYLQPDGGKGCCHFPYSKSQTQSQLQWHASWTRKGRSCKAKSGPGNEIEEVYFQWVLSLFTHHYFPNMKRELVFVRPWKLILYLHFNLNEAISLFRGTKLRNLCRRFPFALVL